MAFTVQYTGSFYNRTGKGVTVGLYKDAAPVTPATLTIQSVVISTNNQGDPVIGTGAKVIIINTSGTFSTYDTLLSNYERQWKMVITYDSVVVFEGFLICDINEQQILENAAITLQATNYLRRLEDVYITALASINARNKVSNLIFSCLGSAGLGYYLYLHSSLYEAHMLSAGDYVFLDQVFVENSAFYKNITEYDDAYTVLSKLLLSFNCFLYSYGTKWVIQRYDDITGGPTWKGSDVGYNFSVSDNLKQEIAKDTDFQYIEQSQRLLYNSGAKTLKINLIETLFFSLVPSDFTTPLPDYPAYPYEPESNVWYKHPFVVDETAGENYKSIKDWLKWTVPSMPGFPELEEQQGVMYKFLVDCNPNRGVDTVTSTLTISYKVSTSLFESKKDIDTIYGRFRLLCKTYPKKDDALFINAEGNAEFDLSGTTVNTVPVTGNSFTTITTEITQSFYLDDLLSLFADVGDSVQLEFVLNILPFKYKLISTGVTWMVYTPYIGDIEVTLSTENIDNEIKNTISDDFVKEEEITLDVFDIDNLNYSNGLMVDLTDSSGAPNDGMVRTTAWGDKGGPYDKSLVDLLIIGKMSKLAQTTKKITARIACDLYLKLFAILTDPDIGATQFILTNYTWDLNTGIYEIEAEEYPATEITLI